MDYTTIYEKDIQTKLDRNEKLLRAKTEQMANLQYEAELITNASIEIIRGIPDHVQMTDLHKIWLDFDNDKGKFKPDGKDSKARLKNGKEFRIALPCYKNANKDNYRSLGYAIMTVDGCSCTTVFSTRFLWELKDGVAKFLNGEIRNE